MPSTTSIIMVSYHTGPALWQAIEAALAAPECVELILVDNGNPPQVELRLRQLAKMEKRLTVISGQGNLGFARACNLGAKSADSEYVMLLNPDSILSPGCIKALAGALEIHPGAMLAGPFLMNPDGSEQRGGRRNLLTPETALAESLSLGGKRLNLHETDVPKTPVEVEAISGACMFLRRTDYLALGGMDERYFLHVEDLDFCVRVAKAGGKTLFVPEAKLLHYRSTSDVSSIFIEWQKAKGFIRYFHTHYREQYPAWLLALADGGILARFVLKAALAEIKRRLPRYRQAQERAERQLRVLERAVREVEKSPSSLKGEGRSILVTGATSQVGLGIMRNLLAAGAEVTALSRSAPLDFTHERLHWQAGDMCSLPLQGEEFFICIHAAPLWLLPSALPALAKTGIKRIVAFSSTSIEGKVDSLDSKEQETVRRLKEAEEHLTRECERLGIAWTILRPTLIYGLGLDANITGLARFIRRWRFLPLYPPASGLRQPVHALDLAKAAVDILTNEKTYGKAYNLSGGETLSYREMAERIFSVLQQAPRVIFLPFLPSLLDLLGKLRHGSVNGEIARRMNRDLAFSHHEATQDFCYEPRSFLAAGKEDL